MSRSGLRAFRLAATAIPPAPPPDDDHAVELVVVLGRNPAASGDAPDDAAQIVSGRLGGSQDVRKRPRSCRLAERPKRRGASPVRQKASTGFGRAASSSRKAITSPSVTLPDVTVGTRASRPAARAAASTSRSPAGRRPRRRGDCRSPPGSPPFRRRETEGRADPSPTGPGEAFDVHGRILI